MLGVPSPWLGANFDSQHTCQSPLVLHRHHTLAGCAQRMCCLLSVMPAVYGPSLPPHAQTHESLQAHSQCTAPLPQICRCRIKARAVVGPRPFEPPDARSINTRLKSTSVILHPPKLSSTVHRHQHSLPPTTIVVHLHTGTFRGTTCTFDTRPLQSQSLLANDLHIALCALQGHSKLSLTKQHPLHHAQLHTAHSMWLTLDLAPQAWQDSTPSGVLFCPFVGGGI